MSYLGSLVVNLSANVAQFQSDLGHAQQIADQSMRQIDAGVALVKSSLVGLAGAFSAGALVEKFHTAVEAMASLNDAADQTGASVEFLSSTLNTLKPTGATLDQITGLSQKLVRAMQGADEETSKAAAAFKALGIETSDSAGNLRKIDDILPELAQKLDGYADGSNKVALLQALLGKSGGEYAKILKDLANEQQAAATVTKEQAEQADRLTKEWARMQQQSEILAQGLASKLVPTLADLVQKFNEATRAGLGFFDKIQLTTLAESSVPKAIDEQVKAISRLKEKRDALAADQRPLMQLGKADGLRDLDDQIKRRETILAELQKRFDPNAVGPKGPLGLGDKGSWDWGYKPEAPRVETADKPKAIRDQVTEGERLLQNLQDRVFATLKLTEVEKLSSEIARGRVKFDNEAQKQAAFVAAQQIDSVKAMDEAQRRELEFERQTESAAKRSAETVSRQIKQTNDLVDKYTQLAQPAEKYRKELEQINDLAARNLLSPETAAQAKDRLQEDLAKKLGQVNDKTKDGVDLARELGMTFESAAENAILKWKSFSDVLQGVLQDIARMGIRQMVSGPITEWARGIFGGSQTPALIRAAIPEIVNEQSLTKGLTVVNHIDSRTDAATIAGIAEQAVKQAVGKVYDMQRRGAWTAA